MTDPVIPKSDPFRNSMTLSPYGLALIKRFEGCVLHVYNDSVRTPQYPHGHATIGYGHLLHKGAFTPQDLQRITQQEADDLLQKDLASFVAAVNKAVHVPLTQNQFDALVSLSFNIGTAGMTTSSLVKVINAGHSNDAAEIRRCFCLWCHPAELLPRRISEATVFLTPNPVAK